MVSSNLPPSNRSDRRPAGILVIEDDVELAESLGRSALERFDMPATLAHSLLEANAAMDDQTPRLVLLDMMLPDGDGTELLLRLARDNVPAVAVVTAAPSLSRLAESLRTRVADFITKPFTSQTLSAGFDRLARRLAEHDELERLRDELARSESAQAQLRRKIDILCKDLVGGYQSLLNQYVTDRND